MNTSTDDSKPKEPREAPDKPPPGKSAHMKSEEELAELLRRHPEVKRITSEDLAVIPSGPRPPEKPTPPKPPTDQQAGEEDTAAEGSGKPQAVSGNQ